MTGKPGDHDLRRRADDLMDAARPALREALCRALAHPGDDARAGVQFRLYPGDARTRTWQFEISEDRWCQGPGWRGEG